MADPRANPYMRDAPALASEPGWQIPGLEAIDWGAHSDAYGAADWVPVYIQALTSADGEERAWGLDALWASINHQGGASEVSPIASPFLVSLLDWPGLPDPGALVRFLAELAVGDSRWSAEAGIELERFFRSTCYPAVAAGAPRFVALLADARPEVRAAAVFACGLVAECGDAARACLEDPLPGIRLAARIAAALHARRAGRALPEARGWASEEGLWARAAGLVALGYAHPERLTAADIEAMGALAAQIPAGRAERRGDHPEGLAWDLHTALRHQALTASIPATLDGMIDRVRGDELGQECGRRALAALLEGEPGEPRPARALGDGLRRLLEAVAQDEALLRAVRGYGDDWPRWLPTQRQHLRRYLGLERGPLNLEVEGAPLWLSLHRVMLGGGPWEAALAVPPEERLALVEDAAEGLRWCSDLSGPPSYEARNEMHDRALVALGELAAGAPGAAAWASARAAALGERPQAAEELLYALTLGRLARARGAHLERLELLNTAHAPVSVLPVAFAQAARCLRPEALEALIASLPLVQTSRTVREKRDPETGETLERVERVSLYYPPWWQVLRGLPGTPAARRVLAAIEQARQIKASRPAPDPILPERDAPFPAEIAREVLLGALPGDL